MSQSKPLGVVGTGAWGTALAIVAARAGTPTVLWGRDAVHVEALRRSGENARHLPGVPLPPGISLTADAADLVACDPWLLVTPAQALRAVIRDLPPCSASLVICAKGLEQSTGLRLSEVLADERPSNVAGSLSGPSFALEVARGLPTAVTVALPTLAAAQDLAARLLGPTFRPYPTDDLIGVELGGAFKNVVAIAAGAVLGRGLGENARAALITRGLAELARLGEAMGARRETLMGLSGLGDLVLTASSLTSRNTSLGDALARGVPIAALMGEGGKLSEGAFTAAAACRLGEELGVDLPIARAVRRLVAGEVDVDAAVRELLARPLPSSE